MNKEQETSVAIKAISAGRREAQRRQRVDEILHASWTVFSAEGHAGFSMRKVAQALGVRLNTVQHYFGDLNSLLLETVRNGLSKYSVGYRNIAVDRRMTAQQRLDTILEDMLLDASEPTIGSISIEIWALARRDAAVDQLVKQMYLDVVDSLALVASEVDPKMSSDDARAIAMVLAAIADGAAVLASSGALPPEVIKRFIAAAKVTCKSMISSMKVA